MSRFSEKCKSLLDENGTNVYRISKATSLERTALQRMITGKRLPNIEFVNEFCQVLRVSKHDEAELLELYKMESIGEGIYRNRQCILSLINHLSDIRRTNYSDVHTQITAPSIPAQKLQMQHGHTSYETDQLLHFVLYEEFVSGEHSCISTNCPLENGRFAQNLMLLYQHYQKRICVNHLFNFQIHPDRILSNLETLDQILPLVLSETVQYHAYYSYANSNCEDLPEILFPYYIITSHHVLLISSDWKQSILHTSEDLITLYQKEFEKSKALCAPLTQQFFTPEEAFAAYIDYNTLDGNYLALEYSPCGCSMLTLEQFQKAAVHCPETLKPLVQMIPDHFLFGHNSLDYFSLPGLEYFCQSGKLMGNIAMFLPPFSIEDRIALLEHYLLDLRTAPEETRLYLLSHEITLSPDLYLEIIGGSCLRMIKMDLDFHINFITITESSICLAFQDFLDTLKDSGMVLSYEETVQIVTNKINELKKSIS